MEIAGLPAHPLVVHGAVVLTPLAAVTALLFAVRRPWRWLLRWPTAALTAASLVTVWLAHQSGEAMVEARPALEQLIEVHEERADLLWTLMLVFAVVTAVAVWALPGPTGLASGRGAQESRVAVLDQVWPVVVVLAALAVLVMVVLVGDAGARAVWAQ